MVAIHVPALLAQHWEQLEGVSFISDASNRKSGKLVPNTGISKDFFPPVYKIKANLWKFILSKAKTSDFLKFKKQNINTHRTK